MVRQVHICNLFLRAFSFLWRPSNLACGISKMTRAVFHRILIRHLSCHCHWFHFKIRASSPWMLCWMLLCFRESTFICRKTSNRWIIWTLRACHSKCIWIFSQFFTFLFWSRHRRCFERSNSFCILIRWLSNRGILIQHGPLSRFKIKGMHVVKFSSDLKDSTKDNHSVLVHNGWMTTPSYRWVHCIGDLSPCECLQVKDPGII